MRVSINENWRKTLVGALLTAACVLPVVAQSSSSVGNTQQKRDKVSPDQERLYVVSAKAGGINHVTGAVRVTRDGSGGGQTQILAKGDELGDKDRISVSDNGRAEILLNPGSFLRLAENTELEFTNTALESLQLKLAAGSALLEATAVGGENGADISITTPQATVRLEKSGIYRLKTDLNVTEIYVWKGAARVGDEIIKSGRRTVVGRNGVMAEVVKFDKNESRDAFDLWSKDRAKDLAKTNNRLKDRELARAFRDSSLFGSSAFGFSQRGSGAGYWVFDRLTRNYCFVPYGFGSWGSPYGFGYNNGISYDRRPVVVFRQPNPVFADPEVRSRPGTGGRIPVVGLPSSPNTTARPAGRPAGRPMGAKSQIPD